MTAVPAPKKLDPTQSLEALYGSMLRKLRLKAGWTQRERGNMIPIAHSRIAQFELGNETPVFDVAEALDRLLKADGDLMDLWQHVVRTPIPNWAIRYLNLEPKAAKIRKCAAHSVPGLLQTEGYARGLLSVARPSVGDGLEKLLAARMARQEILGRSTPPVLWAVLDEAVLHRVVDQPSVMSEQLKHLLDVAESRNEITLQVLPFSAGAHPLLDGSATVTLVSPVVLHAAAWRKSSYSNTRGGDCVEVADGFPGVLPVRDSKVPDGPTLVFGADAWSAFIAGVGAGA